MTLSKEETKVNESTKKPIVGIPRGLYFYKYFPLWKAFLEYLGCEVRVGPPTSAKLVEEGSKAALSELCVPMKIFYGHVMWTIKEYPDLDYIFIPRYVSTHESKYYCPKFMILPEAIKYGLNLKIPVLVLDVNAKKHKGIEGAIKLASELGIPQEKAGKAWYFAMEKYKAFKEKAKTGDIVAMLDKLDPDPKHKRAKKVIHQKIAEDIRGKFPVNILILGHPYNVYETHINMDLITRLKAMDAVPLTMENLDEEVFKEPVTINKQYHNYWDHEEEILQTARYYIFRKNMVDGIIFLISFACGPDSIIQELVMRDMKKRGIPFLNLILDEHSGESGLVTRIESFVDMVRREKYSDLQLSDDKKSIDKDEFIDDYEDFDTPGKKGKYVNEMSIGD